MNYRKGCTTKTVTIKKIEKIPRDKLTKLYTFPCSSIVFTV